MNQFLRYSPQFDDLTPQEEELLQEDIQLIEKAVKASPEVNETGYATRNAHAKAFGFLRGTFVPVKNEAVDFAQLLKGENLGVIIRYSHPNFFVTKGSWEYPVYGCSLKIFNKNLPESAKYPLVNLPVFVTNSVPKFLNIHIKANKFFIALRQNLLFGIFKIPGLIIAGLKLFFDKEIVSILRNMLKVFDIERKFISTYDYHSIGCFRAGDRVVKIRVKQNFKKEIQKGNEFAQKDSLKEYFMHNELQLDFQVQVAINEKKTPVNNLLKMWREKHSPFITVGKIILPQQDISAHETMDYENLSFNPFENNELLQPVGRMQKIRQKIYKASVATRKSLNQNL